MKSELIKGFTRNDSFLASFIEGKSKDFSELSITNSNTIGWIIGHLIFCRGHVISSLGGDYKELEYEKLCGRGVDKQPDFSIDLTQATRDFVARGEEIEALISEKNGDDLGQGIGRTMPDGSSDLAGFLAFMGWHEAFHLGQIDMIQIGNNIAGIQ